ncbi:hypothetical protein ACLSU7_07260 [Bdellovibrio sp. HCB185ZH]|uniref:hypothetical protein n=1 Tax=Bdellovibrio sp. HCB185ZH TaxID=3394235 RepID=UPI0039A57CE2
MKFILSTFLILLSAQAFAQTTYRAIQPLGAISKGSQISVKSVGNKNTFFNPNQTDSTTESGFKTVSNDSLYEVQSIKNNDSSADSTTLKSLANSGDLVLNKSSLNSADQGCVSKGTCTLNYDAPVYQSSKFNFFDWFLNLFGMGDKPKSLVTPTDITDPKSSAAAASTALVTNTNRTLSGQDNVCADLPDSVKNDPTFKCGLQMALDAYKKNKASGKVTSDTFIFNDFADGEMTGKMYFFNSQGQVAQVLDKNPIPVSRGAGGFGAGTSSQKTPNGAIVTRRYDPPRSANIKDGIELDGLEAGNKDIHGRGVLLHGWNPYTFTAGCLGVQGTFESRKLGYADEMGGRPLYLDQLKSSLLKDGGVMIYNFTPAKVREGLCRNRQ